MLTSCVILVAWALAVCCIAFGILQIHDGTDAGPIEFLFVFFGFMFLFSGMGMYRRKAKAHRTAIVTFATFTAFGTVYLILSYSEQVLLFVISTAVCLLISLTKYVADWNSLNG